MKVIFLGPPGSGKGTQAKRMQAVHHIPQVSTGDLLRAAVRQGTALGKAAKEHMDAGRLVPDPLVIALILERIQERDCARGLILDGFPRTLGQAKALDEALKERKMKIDAVVNFDVDLAVLTERLVGRRVCPKGHGEWHVRFNPPRQAGRCDVCGEALIQREDDQEERIRTRLKAYQQDTAPLIDHYRKQQLLSSVNAVGELEEISAQIEQVFQQAAR
jgi:adenylate kinase